MKNYTNGCITVIQKMVCVRYEHVSVDNPKSTHDSKGTWSHKGVLFKNNPEEKM